MCGTVDGWHTLEEPAAVRRGGRYYCFYSGGSWQGAGYGVGWAQEQHPLGPWTDAVAGQTQLLTSVPGHEVGPGHASLTCTREGTDILNYHAWDAGMIHRRMCIDPLLWTADGRWTPSPTWNVALLPD
jgi:GH43 family beta-xylosidase